MERSIAMPITPSSVLPLLEILFRSSKQQQHQRRKQRAFPRSTRGQQITHTIPMLKLFATTTVLRPPRTSQSVTSLRSTNDLRITINHLSKAMHLHQPRHHQPRRQQKSTTRRVRLKFGFEGTVKKFLPPSDHR